MTPEERAKAEWAVEFLFGLVKRRGVAEGCDEDWDGGSIGQDLRYLAKHMGISCPGKMDDVTVSKIEFPDKDGGVSLTAKSPAFAILATECVKLFKEAGGVNYCEWRLNSGDPAFGTFTVLIQREAGETAAQQNAKLRAEAERLKARYATLSSEYLQEEKALDAAVLQLAEEKKISSARNQIAYNLEQELDKANRLLRDARKDAWEHCVRLIEAPVPGLEALASVDGDAGGLVGAHIRALQQASAAVRESMQFMDAVEQKNQTEKRVGSHQNVDTCENYRRDGETQVRSRFCSKFDVSHAHAPTCQFFRK